MIRVTWLCASDSADDTLVLPATAPARSCVTRVPMFWNSGIPTNCTPVYGTLCRVECVGSAVSIELSTMPSNAPAAFLYAGFLYVEMRVPGGTLPHPFFAATSLM